jgi:S1-C subfamily serine protease
VSDERPGHRDSGASPLGWLVPVALTGIVVFLAWRLYEQSPKDVRDPDSQTRPVVARGDLAADEKSTVELFKTASPAVVQVTNIATRRNMWTGAEQTAAQGSGSGFVWDPQGYVVTNFHVVEGGTEFTVTFPSHDVFEATMVGIDPVHDLAVLKFDRKGKPLPALPIGTSSDLQVGQKVYAIGNPFGLDQTLTTGIISGLNREILSRLQTPIRGVIQTDAAINPGNSGGPLLDSAGRVIGVNTQIASTSGASAGVGFAIPVDVVNRVVPQLIRTGKAQRPGLGVAHIAQWADPRSEKIGLVFLDYAPTSAAREAGLRATTLTPDRQRIAQLGDMLLAVDGRPVATWAQMVGILDAHEIWDEVEVTYLRDGKEERTKLKLVAVE